MKNRETVIVVGIGISSAMIAHRLYKEGYEVVVCAKGPDPRINNEAEQHGSTGNGSVGRFVTGFEGETYLSNALSNNLMYPDMQKAFQTPITEGGWLARSVHEYSQKDQEWLQKRYEAANDQGRVQKVFRDYYIKNNTWSIDAWRELAEIHPKLFEGTDMSHPYGGILRLYDNKPLYDYALRAHKEYKFWREDFTPDAVAQCFPEYKEACDKGYIAGGLRAVGFSLNIQQFVFNVISYLEREGVQFFWDIEITKIEIKGNGVVQGLRTKSGQMLTAMHYCVNPGAYGTEILDNTPAGGKLGGVAGRWIILPQPPRPDWLRMPTKIHGSPRMGFPLTDNNLTPFIQNGEMMVASGAGYLYVGSNPKEYAENKQGFKIFDDLNDRVLSMYLGGYYDEAKKNGLVTIWPHSCVRSFTYNDEPIHEIMNTTTGGFLTITAGTNTGTTTLAPHLAEWTANVLLQK